MLPPLMSMPMRFDVSLLPFLISISVQWLSTTAAGVTSTDTWELMKL
jgi:hypothetical protein